MAAQQFKKSILSHKSDRNADYPVHFYQTFLTEHNFAASNGLTLPLTTAQPKILISNHVSWMHQQLNLHRLENVMSVQLMKTN